MAYSIETALKSDLFNRVYVSTDSIEIGDVAKQYGAKVIARPSNLADHVTGTQAVMKHALSVVGAEIACCIYATCPMLTVKDLLLGANYLGADANYAFSVTTYDAPIWKALRGTTPIWPQHIEKPSQDFETIYHDAGMFYWGKASSFRQEESLYSKWSKFVPIPRERVQDIDTLEDWSVAELKYKVMHG